uniref:PDZ domain-containing protein n=1 Tax=Syphacia muris TaxID=451379 RepID=A0A0N5AB05_9BILA
MIKSYWEANIQREEKLKEESNNVQKKKTFGFPRWRSNDALTASLVASKPNVEIPADSKIPQHRLKKLEQTELLAQQTKAMIQQSAEVPKKLQKGKSLDSLIMQLDYQPWYDRNQIRDGISRESIANLVATKDKFECSVESGNNRRHTDSINSSVYYDSQTKLDQRYSADRQKEKVDSYINVDEDNTSPQDSQPELSQEKQLYNNSYGLKENSYTSSRTMSIDDRQQLTPNIKNPDMNITAEQEMFLSYVKQNSGLIESLGIIFPNWVKNIINELPWRKVELKSIYEEEPRRPTSESKSYQPQSLNKDLSNQPQSNKSGRYLKNPAAINGNNNHRIMSRKTFDMSSKQIPENRRPIMQEVDRERAGDSLIAAEIRMLRDREEELRRSRSELGLPSLEDTIEIWRNGIQPVNPLRSAVSYDHLHQAVQEIPKAGSIERLHRIVDEQPRKQCENDISLLSLNQSQFMDEKQNRQNLQGTRRYEKGRSIYPEDEIVIVNQDRNIQKIPYYQPIYSKNHYKLQNSDDPDIMIYGPTSRRYSGTLTDSRFHLTSNSFPIDHKNRSMYRYE